MNFIRFRSNSLCIENISALRLAKKYQTPFYCYSLAQLRNNFLRFNNIFKNIELKDNNVIDLRIPNQVILLNE